MKQLKYLSLYLLFGLVLFSGFFLIGTKISLAEIVWYDVDTPAGTTTDWYTASSTCDSLSTASSTNWRLPTKGELLAKYFEATTTPPGFTAGVYWSGTVYDSAQAYWVSLNSGNNGHNYMSKNDIAYSRCVYTSGAQDIYGCTDSNAINYNILATIDDGSCTYPTISVGHSGVQMATTTIPLADQNLGGAFTLSNQNATTTVEQIVLTQAGTLTDTYLTNLRLYYKTATTCDSVKPADATFFGTSTAFVNNIATTTGSMAVGTNNICLYAVYDTADVLTEILTGQTIDLKIMNPSTDITISIGTVIPNTAINISGATIIVNPLVSDILSLKMKDSAKNPTVFYLKDQSVWKKEAYNNPVRLTNANLIVQLLTFLNLTGSNNAGTVKMNMTVSNASIGTGQALQDVTRTYSTTATVRALSGENITVNNATNGASMHRVIYDGNGYTGGTPPTDSNTYTSTSTVTVLDNTGALVKTGYTFTGWNTLANGSGTDRATSSTFTMGTASVTLYAKWTANPTYTVTYDGNGNTSGTAPTDSNTYASSTSVTVLDNTGVLIKTGYTFAGWNTLANGNGIDRVASSTFLMGATNTILYAKWATSLSYVSQIGTVGTGNDQFNYPEGITSDGTYLYIADSGNNRIVKRLASDLSYVSKIGTGGSGNDQFSSPTTITNDGTYLYISDTNNHRIVKRLASDLSYVSKIGSNGNGNDQFNYPFGITIGITDDTAYLYIADTYNRRIVKRLASDLSYVSKIGSNGNGDNQFNIPFGIVSDGTYIYVADTGNNRIVKRLTSDLSYVSQIGTYGNGNDQFYAPVGITNDNTHLYVVDAGNNRIVKRLASDLSYVSKIGTYGSGNNQFDDSHGITNNGPYIYVADSYNNRIVKRYK